MEKITKICFVCKKEINDSNFEMNREVYLPVCSKCNGSQEEKKMVEEYLDSLADGLVCGCI